MLCHPEHPRENVDLAAVVAHKALPEFFWKLFHTKCMTKWLNQKLKKTIIPPHAISVTINASILINNLKCKKKMVYFIQFLPNPHPCYLISEYVTKNTCIISTVYNISQGVVNAEIQNATENIHCCCLPRFILACQDVSSEFLQQVQSHQLLHYQSTDISWHCIGEQIIVCNCMIHYLVVRLVNESPVSQNKNNIISILQWKAKFSLNLILSRYFCGICFPCPTKWSRLGRV